jgi:hypothetical protein
MDNELLNGNIPKQLTTFSHLVQIDTRDCIGRESLKSAVNSFESDGGRNEAQGILNMVTGIGTSPIKVGIDSTSISENIIKNGDTIQISNVQGNTNANGTFIVKNTLNPDPDPSFPGASFELGTHSIGNANYAGGGSWFRAADIGYPKTTQTSSIITGNEMIIKLQKKLKAIRSFSLIHSTIPRDFIPIEVYFKDLYLQSTNLPTQTTTSPFSVWDTFIPQEKIFMESMSIGFYSTPIMLLRSYQGSLALPNQVSPPPLELWNPPVGTWPSQPLPYPYQVVPTYSSESFNIPDSSSDVIIVCSGYGLYDLNDWTSSTGDAAFDRIITELARKLLLFAIVQPQSYSDVSYINMILNCTTTSNDTSPFGYGNFQRFLPGPGVQMNYQPGTSDSSDPRTASVDSPVPFPNFKGNVWGPYDIPGDRFQRLGLRDTVQDLYLNGDLNNLSGSPIVKAHVATENIMIDPTLGINFKYIQPVDLSNVSNSTNPNILNAMRIVSNGFGATSIRSEGFGNPDYTNTYLSSGGIGPSALGAPSAWSLTGIYGAPDLSDPNAVGPNSNETSLSNGEIPQIAEGNDPAGYPAQTAEISHRIGWFDLGANEGVFLKQIKNYTEYIMQELPDTNLIIHAFQVPRDFRVQSTNSKVGDSIFSCPIRLSVGTSTGNAQYVENLDPLLASSSEFWERRFLSPLASMDKITLTFTTYGGIKIPIEKMLQLNKTSTYIENFERLFGSPNSDLFSGISSDGGLSYLFDPLDPTLLNRTNRALSLMFKVDCYQYTNIGLNIHEQVNKILGIIEDPDSDEEFTVRAGNYENYS